MARDAKPRSRPMTTLLPTTSRGGRCANCRTRLNEDNSARCHLCPSCWSELRTAVGFHAKVTTGIDVAPRHDALSPWPPAAPIRPIRRTSVRNVA
jgi:hypothetical protein